MPTAALLVAIVGSSSVAAEVGAPLATPIGVTVEDAGRAGRLYANAQGKTLYTYDNDATGKSECVAECALAWPPLEADPDAASFGDWSVIERDDGSRQWALRGKPLYTFVKDEKPGDKKGDGVAEVWQTAAFAPVEGFVSPPDVSVRENPSAPGQVLVNAAGMTLYSFDTALKDSPCADRCLDKWAPLSAPAIANAIGEFTPVYRGDGLYQWAFRGKPLYSYAGDTTVGELHGRAADDRFDVAVVVRYFTPGEASILYRPVDPIHPAILTAADGMTLYAREKWAYTQTFHARDGDRHGANYGRAVGLEGCVAECLSKWRPLLAPTGARPSGDWTLYSRDDGDKQWAYRGFALYTFTGDENPGDMRSDESFEPWRGENAKVGMKPFSVTATASTMYWRVASP